MRSPSGSKEICNGSARERYRPRMCIGCGTNRVGESIRTGGLAGRLPVWYNPVWKYTALVTVRHLYSSGQKSIPDRLCDGIIDTAGTQKEEKS